jgi:TRAP-type C4-dicarboxylate transport system substrate-binding protein
MKKHKKLMLVLAVMLALVTALAGCGGGGDDAAAPAGSTGGGDAAAPAAEPVTLQLTMHDPNTSRMGQAIEAWAQKISDETNGGLTIKVQGGGVLAGSNEALNVVLDGTADIGWVFTMMFPDQFPLTEVVSLPMNGPTNPAQTAAVLWDLYDSTPEMKAEIDDKVHVLQMYGNPMNFISTVDKPIKSVADIKGMRLRCPAGGMTEVMKLWGANPEVVPAGDTGQQLESGVIAGTSWEWQGLEAFSLYEQLNYYMEGMGIYEGVFLLAMNKEKYDSLPQEYKDVLDANSGRDSSIEMGKTFADAANESKEAILAADPDGVVIGADEINIAEFQAPADEYASTWAANHTTDAFDAAAYLAKSKELVEKYKDI